MMPPYVSIEIAHHDLAPGLEQILELNKLGYKRYYFFNQGMRRHVKAPMPPREGHYAEFRPEAVITGLFGKEIDGRWISFNQAVERVVTLNRLHL
jgi:hypothetical protein